MLSEDEIKPTIECKLEASTLAGLPQNEPTLTNLDCATTYKLTLKRINEKAQNDQLIVEISLGLHPDFFNDSITEKDLLNKWAIKHPFENLFDLELNDGIEDLVTRTSKHSVGFVWIKKNEIDAKIRFNCVSSQYPFKRKLSSNRGAIFVLAVKVKSQNTLGSHGDYFCQIKLFWKNLAKFENDKASCPTLIGSTTVGLIPSCDYTKLIPYDLDQWLCEQDNQIQLLNDYIFETDQSVESFLNDYEEIYNLFDLSNQNYLYYNLEELGEYYYHKNDQSVKAIFIEQNQVFKIKLIANSDAIKQLGGKTKNVITSIKLELFNRQFEQYDPKLFEFVHEQSKLLSNIQDVRMLRHKAIIIWRLDPNQTDEEIVLAFKINGISCDFTLNEMPFRVTINSYLKRPDQMLDSASLDVFTLSQKNFELEKREWEKMRDLVVSKNHGRCILNRKPEKSSKTASSSNQNNFLKIPIFLTTFALFVAVFAISVSKYAEMQDMIYAQNETMYKLTAELTNLNKQVSILTENLRVAKSEITDLNYKSIDQDNTNERLKNTIRAHDTTIREFETKLIIQTKQIRDLSERLKEATSMIDSYQTRMLTTSLISLASKLF